MHSAAPDSGKPADGVQSFLRPSDERLEMSPAHPQTITLLLLDGHEVVRLGIRALFAGLPGFQVLAEATLGEQAYALYCRLQPTVLIMDLNLPGIGDQDVLQRILCAYPAARVLVYTADDGQTQLDRALEVGALGYVTKGNHAQVLIQAVQAVAEGRRYVSNDMLNGILDTRYDATAMPQRVLTGREREIFLLLARGRSVKECAHTLRLSSKTVGNHATHIKRKLGVANQVELTRLALRLKLIE